VVPEDRQQDDDRNWHPQQPQQKASTKSHDTPLSRVRAHIRKSEIQLLSLHTVPKRARQSLIGNSAGNVDYRWPAARLCRAPWRRPCSDPTEKEPRLSGALFILPRMPSQSLPSKTKINTITSTRPRPPPP
jgi:hypothetical protein